MATMSSGSDAVRIVERLGADDETQAVVITGGGREFFSMGS